MTQSSKVNQFSERKSKTKNSQSSKNILDGPIWFSHHYLTSLGNSEYMNFPQCIRRD